MASSTRPKSPADRDGDIRMGSLNNLSTTSVAPKGKAPARQQTEDSDSDDGPIRVVKEDRKDSVKIEPFWGSRDGTRNKLSAFLIQLKMAFKLNPTKYATGPDKVMYAAMHLKGAAFAWFEPTMKDYVDSETADVDTQACFRNFAEFERRIKKVFGTLLDSRAASRTIYTIRQRTSAAAYYSEFHQVASKLSWDDEDAFAEIFYNGLKEEVRKHMMDPPTKYKAMVDEAIKIDNRLHELRLENGNQRQGQRHYEDRSYRFKNTYRPQGDPMDLSAMTHGRPSKANQSKGRGRGGYHQGNREKERQMKENLCFKCNKPGHRARECSAPAQGLHMMSDDKTGLEETKADTSNETQTVTDDQGKTAQKGHQESGVQEELGDPEGGWADKETYEHYAMERATTPARSSGNAGLRFSTFAEALDERFGKEGAQPPAATTALAEACQNETEGYTIRKAAELNKQPDPEHAALSWTACYDDSCHIHYSDKVGTKWFPSRYSKRRNRQNKRSKEQQEALAEKGDLTEDGEGPIDDSFWMMNAPETKEKTIFVVTCVSKDHLFMVTPYWKKVDCWYSDCLLRQYPEHQHDAFDPETTPKGQKLVKVEFCKRQDCHINGTHAHQGREEDMLPIDIPAELGRHIDIDTEPSLSTDNDEETTELPVPKEEETETRTHLTMKTTAFTCAILTTQWRKEPCEAQDTCALESQHAHYIHDEGMEPKGLIRKIKYYFCRAEDCECKEILHVHQCDDTVIEIKLQEEEEKQLRREWEKNNLSMMTKQEPDNEEGTTIDDRAYNNNMWNRFSCHHSECPYYLTKHEHLFNMDPRYPHLPIHPFHYQDLVTRGQLCQAEECPWVHQLHIHFEAQSIHMMIGNADYPDIVEDIVDERSSEHYLADYFPCTKRDCGRRGGYHRHLYNVDPQKPITALSRRAFDECEDCEDPTCEWEHIQHKHLPKNL